MGIRRFIFSLILIFGTGEYGIAGLSKELKLTKPETDTLLKFKKRVSNKTKFEYQRSDLTLVRWLRANKFNLMDAENMLLKDLKWREEEKMDTISAEKWPIFEQTYPYATNSIDKEGKPILTANFGEWDMTSAVVSGKKYKLMRWMARSLNEAVEKVRNIQAKNENVTQWNFIINMKDFNLVRHVCTDCTPIYVNFVSNYEDHFPGSADKIILINTPEIFQDILKFMRPVMSPRTSAALKIYGTNRSQWLPMLLQNIEKNQLPKAYGGTKAT